MKASELRQMSDEQLLHTLREAEGDLFRFRIKARTQRLDTPSELKKKRRLIARIMTLQTERSLVKQPAGAAK